MVIETPTERELLIIRGKLMMDHSPSHDIWKVFAYLDELMYKLDDLDLEDFFGTEGWRHQLLGEDT